MRLGYHYVVDETKPKMSCFPLAVFDGWGTQLATIRALIISQLTLGLLLSGLAESIAAENLPPEVSIVWPNTSSVRDHFFSHGTLVKIKAEAHDPDGVISEVRFYASTNLIGVSTNPPFNVLWVAVLVANELPQLRAVAVDNDGATTESPAVEIVIFNGAFVQPVVEILSPVTGSMFPAPAQFAVTAEVFASLGDDGPIEFFVGTNSVGLVASRGFLTATSPPVSVVVSNLAEGNHDLSIRYRGAVGSDCITCILFTNHVRVVRLGAIPFPRNQGEPFRFEVITVFTNQATVVERSGNLQDWFPIGTVTPSSNRFTFTDSAAPPGMQQFYRVVVPP